MHIESMLQEIIDRLEALDKRVTTISDPSVHVSKEVYTTRIATAMRLGNREEVKRLTSLMNKGRS